MKPKISCRSSQIGVSSPTAQKRLPSFRFLQPSSPPPRPEWTASCISRANCSSSVKTGSKVRPSISSSDQPRMSPAPRSQLVTRPPLSVLMMAVSIALLTICRHWDARINSGRRAGDFILWLSPGKNKPSREDDALNYLSLLLPALSYTPVARRPTTADLCSRHRVAPQVLAPTQARRHLTENAYGLPHIGVTQVQGRNAETHHIGSPKVADNSARNQRLHEFVSLCVRQRDVASAPRRVAGRRERQAASRQRVNALDEQFRQRLGLAPHLADIYVLPDFEGALERCERDHGGRSNAKPRHARGRIVVLGELERSRMPHPRGEARADFVLQIAPHIEKCRRPWAAVQIFVSAADGKIRARSRNVGLQRSDTMGQIPQDARALCMRPLGDGRKIEQLRGLVVDMRKHDQEGRLIDPLGDFRSWHGHDLDGASRERCQALQHIDVSRKVPRFRDDAMTGSARHHRGTGNLEQIDRGRVGDQYFIGPRADQGRNFGAQPVRQIEPPMNIPAPHEIRAPLVLDYCPRTRHGPFRQRSQRVAVQVDYFRIEQEFAACLRERIARIPKPALIQAIR